MKKVLVVASIDGLCAQLLRIAYSLEAAREDGLVALLRYKFGKIGIPAKCIDMAKIRRSQNRGEDE